MRLLATLLLSCPASTHDDGPIRHHLVRGLIAAIALIASLIGGACSRNQYTKVTRTDGSTVIGTLVTMRPDVVVLQTRQGRIEIRRSDVKSLDVPTISEIAEIEGTQSPPGSMARNAAGGTTDPAAKNGGAGPEKDPGTKASASDPGVPGGQGGGGQGGGARGNSGSASGGAGGSAAGTGGSGPGGSGAGGSGSGGSGSGSQGYASGGGTAGQGAQSGTPASGAAGTQAARNGGGAGSPGDSGSARLAPMTIPAGTAFTVTFDAPLGSDTSRVEEDVTATLVAPIVVEARASCRLARCCAAASPKPLPPRPPAAAGGSPSASTRSRSTHVRRPIDGPTMPIVAPVFTRDDKRKVGIGAAAGAVLGGIVSRTKKAVGIGAAAGAGGTAAAVGVRNELRLARGAKVRLLFTQHVFVPAR